MKNEIRLEFSLNQLYDYLNNWQGLMRENEHLKENEQIRRERQKALKEACICIKLLENKCIGCSRQPMKPNTSNLDEQDTIVCPACGNGLARADDCFELPRFCPECGQMLDWG